MTVAIEWVRVSSDGQADAGTHEAQRAELDRLRAIRPATIVERVEALGISGALPIAQRPDVRQVEAIIVRGGVDELRVVSLDRITRAESLDDRLHVLLLCARHGVRIVETSGRVIDPREDLGAVEYVMRAGWAKQERERIRARTIAGRQRAAREGRLGFGHPCWPYLWERDHVEVDEDGAQVVRRIFRLLADGVLTGRIADELNAECIPTPFGSEWGRRYASTRYAPQTRWTTNTVRTIGRQRAFLGVFEMEMQGEVFALDVPALVDRETWDRAQRHIDARYKRTGRPRTAARGLLIQGLAICAECGQPIYGKNEGGARNKVRRDVYSCRSRLCRKEHGPPCANTRHDGRAVDAAVWNEVCRLVTQPELLLQLLDQPQRDTSQWHEQLRRCEEELKRLGDVRDQWLTMSRRGLISMEELEGHLRSIQTDTSTLRRTAEVARQAIAAEERTAIVAADISAALPALAEKVADASPEDRRDLVRALVPKGPPFGIYLGRDGTIEIVGGFSPAVGGGGRGSVGAASRTSKVVEAA